MSNEQCFTEKERLACILSYAFSQVIIELPYIFAQAAVYSVIVYAVIGFEWTATKFFWNLDFVHFMLLYFTFYGMMTVAVTPNQNIAAIVLMAFYAMWNFFLGFVVPRTRIPVWWRWYYWTCPFAWTLYGLFVLQYGDSKNVLDTNETVEEFLRSYYGFRQDFIGVVAVMAVGFPVLFAFIFAVSIKMLNFQK